MKLIGFNYELFAGRRAKSQKVSTEYLECIDDTVGGQLLSMNEWDAIREYGYLIYGYVTDDEIDKYLNPKRKKGGRDETVTMKIGMLKKGDAESYKGMTVEEALCERCKMDHPGSDEHVYYLVICFPSNKTDHEFRRFLCKSTHYAAISRGDGELVRGISRLNLKEWHNKYINGVKASKAFLPSESQERAICKIVSWYKHNCGKFLLAAKMRFGKNFVILNSFERLGWKKILFSTYSPSVFDSMVEDVNDHVKMSQIFEVIDLREKNAIECIVEAEKLGKSVIILASMQLLNYRDGINDTEKKNLELLKRFNIDCFVLDESHNGGHSEYPKSAINYLEIKNEIHMTGTHSKYVNDMDFSTGDNVFTYDIVDECNDMSERAKTMPRMKFLSMSIPSTLSAKIRENYLPFERFSFRRLFDVDSKGKFKYPGQVKTFLKVVFGGYDSGSLRENENFRNLSIYNLPIDEPINHCLVVLPKNTRIVKAVYKVLREILPDGIKVVMCSGNDGERSIERVRTDTQNNDKTITLVCKRFIEGVNVPLWNAVVMLNDTKSVDEYYQASYRGQTPMPNNRKQFCYVIDYNPERFWFIRHTDIYRYGKAGYTTDQYAKALSSCAPIISYNDSGNIVSDDIVYSNIVNAYRNMFNDGCASIGADIVNIESIDGYADCIGEPMDANDSSEGTTVDVNTNSMKPSKEAVTFGRITTQTNDKDLERYRRIVLTKVKKIPEAIFLAAKCGIKLKNSLEYFENKVFLDIFAEIAKVDSEKFKTLLVDEKIANDAIDAVCNVASSDSDSLNYGEFRRKWFIEITEDELDISEKSSKLF